MEFEQARQSYDWLIDKLELYKPTQREYGRLNLSGTILSKRKLNQVRRTDGVMRLGVS